MTSSAQCEAVGVFSIVTPRRPFLVAALPRPLRRCKRFASQLLCGVALTGTAHAGGFDPYPLPSLTNDFGGVGLIQTPTARFAPDGQLTAGYNQVRPYDRYFVTLQATSWLEATLRYTSVENRLYSLVPAFSGNQTFKDRGFDVKFKLMNEGRVRPAFAIGFRDFVGTGLFSSEYLVANKSIGPLDASFGVGWGNLGARGDVRNPFTLISSSFDTPARCSPRAAAPSTTSISRVAASPSSAGFNMRRRFAG